MNISNNTAIIFDSELSQWKFFQNPVKVITTDRLEEVILCLNDVNNLDREKKFYIAGFVSYDASPAFDSVLNVKSEKNFLPLLWFGVYEQCSSIELPEIKKTGMFFRDWKMSVSKDEYDKGIAAVKHNIYEGNTYQVNYTTRQYSEFCGNPFLLFCEISNSQKAKYSAFIETEDFAVCSASPELFFTYKDNIIISKPMKGTAKRKYILEEDEYQAEWLHNSLKNRAENVMILDMIRNDIGRIAEPGSVEVTEKFKVEKYPTVWQMTSTVKAITYRNIVEIFKALFPCASITGAPKAYTMKIISEIEATSRGIYTGAIGFITPEDKCQFNVAIRTVAINKKTNIAEFGVGGGIVWDSTDKDEYEECLIKTKFLNERSEEFCILESILWTQEEGFFLLDYHFRRMQRAAAYFAFPLSINSVLSKLELMQKEFIEIKYKIRVMVNSKGIVNCEYNALLEQTVNDSCLTKIASEPVNIETPFVYYKTTNRKEYDKFKRKYSEYYDVVLWNDKGEVTETTVANIVIEINGAFFTPPVKCGLLAGTFREYLLTVGKIKEKIITVDELKTADSVYLINSIRKWVKLNIV